LYAAGYTQTLPDSIYTDIGTMRDSGVITKKTLIFVDTENVSNLTNITQQQFSPLSKFKNKEQIPPRLVTKPAYLQFGIFNSSNSADTVYFFPGILFEKINIYKKTENGLNYISNGHSSGYGYIHLAPNEKADIIVGLEFCRQNYNYLKPQIIRKSYIDTFKKVTRLKSDELKTMGFVLSGMLLMLILFTLVNYALTRKKEFFYYIAYALPTFFLVFFYASTRNYSGSFTCFFNGYLDLFLLITGNVFYLVFSRHFLNTKTKHKKLDKIFKAAEWFLLGLLLIFTLVHYLTDWYLVESFFENAMKFIVLGIGILFIIAAFKQKEKLMIYLAIGSAFSIIFSGISLTIILIKLAPAGLFTAALFYHEIGLLFAMGFFLLGLTYKNRSELIGRIKEQEALKLDVEKKDFENQIAIIKAQQEERNRISADMHDDLGAGMTTIRLYSELAKNKIGDRPIPEIEKISSSANELLNKMNAIIWSMSSSNDSLGNMIAYIRSYSLEYFENSGVNCNISIPENLPNIVVSGEIRRNVFLVVKEALNNVLKHSKATEVNIKLQRVPDGLKLFIQDNGVGIDFEKLRQFGNGLKNMKKRMDDIGIIFSIENNNGTLVTLHRVVTDINFSS
jgi:signal transduction histidine kinase